MGEGGEQEVCAGSQDGAWMYQGWGHLEPQQQSHLYPGGPSDGAEITEAVFLLQSRKTAHVHCQNCQYQCQSYGNP